MAIDSLSLNTVINTLTGGTAAAENNFIYYDFRSGAGAASVGFQSGYYTSCWLLNHLAGNGSAPGATARNPTNSTDGALPFTNPATGYKKYLIGSQVTSVNSGPHILADRLADISGLSGTVTTAQNTTSLSVSRYTGTEAAGNRIFLEIYSVVGTTPTTVTASYTNENGVSGRTTQAVTFGGSGKREVGRMIYLPFQAGDFGARSVQSVTVLATTGTAGDFGVTIVRPITPMLSSSIMFTQEYLTQLPPTKELKSDACLFLMANLIVTSSGPNIYAMLSMIEVAD
jgi:hypothetical protein